MNLDWHHTRRRLRRAFRISRWPRHRQIALGVWVPVFVAGLWYVGPHHDASGTVPADPNAEWAMPFPAPATSTIPTVPADALEKGALDDITPPMPPAVSDRLRLLIERSQRARNAIMRPKSAARRELDRMRNALQREVTARKRPVIKQKTVGIKLEKRR